MPREPQTNEEYIEQVTAQAQQQESETVLTHEQILHNYESTRQDYKDKKQLYTFLLLALIIAYIAVYKWEEICTAFGNGSL